jgi:hypothetical protein
MGNVPTTNLNAYYANTTPGNTINSGVIDPALQDLAQTINDNYALFSNFITELELPIPDQSIVTRHIRNSAIITSKLANLGVTTEKLADGSITLAKLADLVVTAAKIANGTITEPKYGTSSVSTRAIAPNSVTLDKLDPALIGPVSDAGIQAKFIQLENRSNSQWINVKYPPTGMVSAKGDGVTDDTVALQVMSDTGAKLYFPYGTYIVSNTLYMKQNGMEWEGEYWLGAIIKFIGTNKELFYGIGTTLIGGVAYSPNYGNMYNLTLQGLGAASNQTAFNFVGYIANIRKLNITGFNTVGVIAGVIVYIEDNYIHNNNNGFIIGPNTNPGTGNISTILRFKNDIFVQNTGIAITNKKDGVYSTIINVNIEDCDFELGGQAFDLQQFQDLKIESCWYESNTTRPSIQKLGYLEINPHYNSEDQKPTHPSIASGIYPYGTGGTVEINANFGYVSVKEVLFQLYPNDHVQDTGNLRGRINLKNNKQVFEITDGTTTVSPIMINDNITNVLYNGEFHVYIKADGSATHDLPSDITTTITKLTSGTYRVTFGTKQISRALVSAEALNANTFDLSQRLHCSVVATNTVDADNYNTYDSFTQITVYCLDLASSNALTDARILITIKPNMWFW